MKEKNVCKVRVKLNIYKEKTINNSTETRKKNKRSTNSVREAEVKVKKIRQVKSM